MITNKKEYKYYLECDLKASQIYNKKFIHRMIDRRFRFYKSLRKTEYLYNCKKSIMGKLMFKLMNMRHIILCDRYNWTIPLNVFGPGLTIVHSGTIVVSGYAKIGKNCRIHVCTNIGGAEINNIDGAPNIGDNAYIGPGAKLYGPIILGDNIAIGANAVVNKSFEEGNCTIAGIPAKKISDKGSNKLIIKY